MTIAQAEVLNYITYHPACTVGIMSDKLFYSLDSILNAIEFLLNQDLIFVESGSYKIR